MKEPGLFLRIVQLWARKGIRALGGPLKSAPSGPSQTQSFRFDKTKYTPAEAKAWLRGHGHKWIKFEPAKTAAQSAAGFEYECQECGYLLAEWTDECEWCGGGIKAAADTGGPYRCECLDCGHVQESKEHCRDIKCEKCGGEMRRVERPGPGQRSESVAVIEILATDGTHPRVTGLAYGGGKMKLFGWKHPVIVDLAGMEMPDEVPLLANHENRTGARIGVVTPKVVDGTLTIEGEIVSTSGVAKGIIEQAKAGAQWSLSIGARPEAYVLVASKQNRTVNGKVQAGPFHHITKSRLGEVSVIPVGADGDAQMRIAAAAFHFMEDGTMTFEEWLKARGIDAVPEDAEKAKLLKATYDVEMKAEADKAAADKAAADKAAAGDTPEPDAADKDTDPPVKADADPALKAVAEIRTASAGEVKRIAEIRAACGDHANVAQQAIEGGWTLDHTKTEVELVTLRAGAPSAIAVGGSDADTTPQVIEAAVRLGGVESNADVEKEYEEPVLDRAGSMRFAGLKELVAMCVRLDGAPPLPFGASPDQYLEAAFSTTTLSGILGNVANKVMQKAYTARELICDAISQKLTANDFKDHTGYRLTGNPMTQQLGANGEIQHMILNEADWTYSVETYGVMLVLTRKEIVNDDLNAFSRIPQIVGRGASLRKANLFWTLVHDNTGNFFSAANRNVTTGVLADATLSTAAQILIEQRDDDGNPVLITPTILGVPPALYDLGRRLHTSREIVVSGDTDVLVGSANIHQGKYLPLTSPYMSNTTFHNDASDIIWYLFGDPQDVAAFGIAYLKGNETPVFEAITLANNVLGRGWRLYHDIGVTQIDPRGAVRSSGA